VPSDVAALLFKLVRCYVPGYAAACARKIREALVAVWQFVVLIGLIGVLLVYASVLTRTIGYANDRLKKIEEALLAKDGPVVHAEARTSAKEREVIRKEPRVGYLTILDLKGRGQRLSSHAARSTRPSSAPIPETLDAPTAAPIVVERAPEAPPLGGPVVARTEANQGTSAHREQVSSDETSALRGDSVVLSLESDHTREAISEPPISSAMPQMSPDSVASAEGNGPAEKTEESQTSFSVTPAAEASTVEASTVTASETRAAQEPTSEKHRAFSRKYPSEDPAARKRREMAYFLSSQRRRRRARLGY
jgi:hypothetical protein